MRTIALAAALAVPVLAAPAVADGQDPAEKGLEDVVRELEAQRKEIETLKARLRGETGEAPPAAVAEEVRKYLESEEGRKALGRGPLDLRASWKDGLNLESADRAFSLHVGGRAQYDMVFPDADAAVEALRGDHDATGGFRRLRVEMDGTIHANVFFKTSVEFADAAYAWRDNLVGVRGIPVVGAFQVGFFKEPMSLEELTSDLYTTFTERSLANALVPSYSHGAMISDSYRDGRLCWWAGDFWDGGTGPAPVQHNLTARLTGAPVLDRERNLVVHLGASASDRSPESETDQFRSRPEAPFVPRLVDSGVFSADTETLLGLEAAAVSGPWSLQGEWVRASCEDHPDAPGPSPTFRGWYVQASWFATGETRPYRNGVFQRVKPKADFDGKGGTGAFEFAARYSVLDLDDDGLAGGVADDWTLGANWLLNPNAHVSVNYVLSNRHGVGDVNSLIVRFQVDF